jgi:hypothetical protein
VEKHRPELVRGMERWRAIVIGGDDTGRRQQAERLIEAAEESFAELDLSLPRDLQLLLADHKYTWMTLYKKLLDSGRRHHAAWLVSSSSIGTGKWLNWRGGFEGRLRFSKDEFVEALRLRLLVDPFPNPGDKVCPLCGLWTGPLCGLTPACPRLRSTAALSKEPSRYRGDTPCECT